MLAIERHRSISLPDLESIRFTDRSAWIAGVFKDHQVSHRIPEKVRVSALSVMRHYSELSEDPRVTEMIERKVNHSRDVVTSTADIISRTPGIEWNVPQALIIALTHDMGRFPQAHRGALHDFKTLFDHGAEGARIVNMFDLSDIGVDRDVVVGAIAAHNSPHVDTEDPYALLIRDADKLALFREFGPSQYFVNHRDSGSSDISPEAMEAFLSGTPVLNKHVHGMPDEAIRMLAWLSDIAFPATRQILKEEGLVKGVLKQLQMLTGSLNPDVAAKMADW